MIRRLIDEMLRIGFDDSNICRNGVDPVAELHKDTELRMDMRVRLHLRSNCIKRANEVYISGRGVGNHVITQYDWLRFWNK